MANMPARRAWSLLSSVACNFTLRVAWSTAGLIALNVPLNSRPGTASVVTRTGRSLDDFPKILLRQRKIDEDVIERLQRNERIGGRDHLPGIDRADARHAIEWSVDFLLVDYRLHVIDHRFFLPVNFDSAASSSALEITLRFARSRARSESALANSASA